MNPTTPTLLIFYTSAGCHLCEQAEGIVAPLIAADPRWTFVRTEIADSVELVDRYGIRIPVIKRSDTGEELGWPFDAEAAQQFLRQGASE